MVSIRFDDQVVIVTGAGNGLGKCHALEFARHGARVVVNDLGGARDGSGSSSNAAAEVVNQIESAGGQAMANGANVADAGQVDAMVGEALEKWGRVDVLVNNAGICGTRPSPRWICPIFNLCWTCICWGRSIAPRRSGH